MPMPEINAKGVAVAMQLHLQLHLELQLRSLLIVYKTSTQPTAIGTPFSPSNCTQPVVASVVLTTRNQIIHKD